MVAAASTCLDLFQKEKVCVAWWSWWWQRVRRERGKERVSECESLPFSPQASKQVLQ